MRATTYNDTGEDPFYQFCDAIETHPDGKVEMTAKGVGMPTALNNYAKWMNEKVANAIDGDCPGEGGACYSTYNYSSTQYTNWTVDNEWDRQWYWMVCTEFGWWQGTFDESQGENPRITLMFPLSLALRRRPRELL